MFRELFFLSSSSHVQAKLAAKTHGRILDNNAWFKRPIRSGWPHEETLCIHVKLERWRSPQEQLAGAALVSGARVGEAEQKESSSKRVTRALSKPSLAKLQGVSDVN